MLKTEKNLKNPYDRACTTPPLPPLLARGIRGPVFIPPARRE